MSTTVAPTKYHIMVTHNRNESDFVTFDDIDSLREYLVYCILNKDYFGGSSADLLDDCVLRAYDDVRLSKLIQRANNAKPGSVRAAISGGDVVFEDSNCLAL